jgi:hypothetical protein
MLQQDRILDYNDQVHRVHLQHHLPQSLLSIKEDRLISMLNKTNFEEMPLNEVIVDHHLVHSIFLNDVMHFLVVIDMNFHPNLRK